ncbi:MAG TPA: hypothetical protein VH951_09385, partial [Dehalococcoidia bacterium]
LSLIVIEAPEERWPDLNNWFAAHLRMTDMVCRDIAGSYFVLLPETDAPGASTVAKRVISAVGVSRLSVGVFGDDEARFRDLLAPLDERWHLRDARAA